VLPCCKDRPNFGFRFGFGAERVDFNTFGIVSVSVESSCGAFDNISVSAAVMPNFGGHQKQVRSSDTVSRCSKSIGCAGQQQLN